MLVIMSNLTDALRGELAGLHAETQRLEGAITQAQTDLRIAREKAEHINGLLALYGAANDSRPHGNIQRRLSVPPEGRQESGPESPPAPVPLGAAAVRQTKAGRLRDQVTAQLLLHGHMHRKDILHALTSAGLMGHEKDPLASLAAFLSDNREIFEPDGRGNFMLRQKSNSDSPPATGRGESGGVAPPAPSLTTQ
jgi:hypothetical protein